jgi:hypothetical protein
VKNSNTKTFGIKNIKKLGKKIKQQNAIRRANYRVCHFVSIYDKNRIQSKILHDIV